MEFVPNTYMIVQTNLRGHYYNVEVDQYTFKQSAGLTCIFPTKQLAELVIVLKGLEKAQVIPVEFKGTGKIRHEPVAGWILEKEKSFGKTYGLTDEDLEDIRKSVGNNQED